MRALPVGELLDRLQHLPPDPPEWGWAEENLARLVDHNASHLQHYWGQLVADPKKAGRSRKQPPVAAPVFHYAARPAEQQAAREDELAAKRARKPSIEQLARMT